MISVVAHYWSEINCMQLSIIFFITEPLELGSQSSGYYISCLTHVDIYRWRRFCLLCHLWSVISAALQMRHTIL